MAGHRVEARGCVRDRARDHAVGGEARPVLAEDRAGRDPAAAGLEADGAAAGGRDADRAAAVGAVGEGAQTRRDRGGGASARATRRMLEVPWVSARAEETVLGGRPAAELGGVGLAEDRAALLLELGDREGVVGEAEGLKRLRAERQRVAGDRDEILDRDRDAS